MVDGLLKLRFLTLVTSCIWSQQIQELFPLIYCQVAGFDSMASSEVSTDQGDETFSQVFDMGEEESFHAPATPPPAMSSTKNIPKPPPLPCVTYHRLQAYGSRPSCSSSSSRLVPKETVGTWDKLFKQGTGADTYVEVDNKSHFLAHSCVLVSFLVREVIW